MNGGLEALWLNISHEAAFLFFDRLQSCWTRNSKSGTKEERLTAEQGMDGATRMSKTEYHRLAERWRRLAADATTAQTRNHLLTLARQCEFLASNVGDVIVQLAAEDHGAGQPDAPQ